MEERLQSQTGDGPGPADQTKGSDQAEGPGIGLRPRLLLGLAVFVGVVVSSIGLVALGAVERQVVAAETERMASLADAMASLLSLGVPFDGGRSSGPAPTPTREAPLQSVQPADFRSTLQRFLDVAGVVEVSLVQGDRALVLGHARGLKPAARDGRALPLKRGLVARRDEWRGRFLVFYRRIPGQGAARGMVLRVVVDRDELVAGLLGRARLAFWGLAAIETLLVLLLGGIVLTRTVTGPLVRLEAAARAVASGNLDQKIEQEGRGEIGRLFQAFSVMTSHLRQNRAVMEEQIHRLAQQARTLEAKQRELDASWQHVIRAEKFATVGRLAAGVAHEVGNPLTALLGYVEILRDGVVEEAAVGEFLERMEKELRRMDEIIRGLLDYSRTSPGEMEEIRLAGVVTRAQELLSAQKRYKGISVETRMEIDVSVVASFNRLVQVLLNLFVNAADAMDGKGRILVAAENGEAGRTVLWICDDGPGVPEDVRDSIFDPFFTTKDVGDGTGLGLSVSRSLMESMEGGLELVTAQDRPKDMHVSGACFRLWLKTGGDDSTDPRREE